MERRFLDRVALVSGAASGIGEATARRLAAQGAKVVLVDRAPAVEAVARSIKQSGGTAMAVHADVSIASEHERVVAEARRQFGALHLAVNNAGVTGREAPLHELSLEEWAEVLNVNLNGVFFAMRAQIPAMLAAGGGAIVNIASVYGVVALRRRDAYTTSKHGVVGLTRSAAQEYAAQNIRINAVCPGVVSTGMTVGPTAPGTPEHIAELARGTSINRVAHADELASAICFVLSDEASFMVGANMIVDGGFTLK